MSVPQVRQGRVDDEEVVEVHNPPRPVVTYAFIAAFALIYLGQAVLPAAPGTFFDPAIQTLVAWGGMSRSLVLEQGDWFRLITAAFLHGGVAHLGMNSLALLIAGSALEPLIGRAWLVALFFIGALAGGLASVTFNPPNIVGVGASGAIMGLFGLFLTIAFRFPKGPVRRAFLANGLGTLIPSTAPALLPAITGGSGFSIDYAAHVGGALAGAAVGLLFLLIWRESRFPPMRGLAVAVVVAGLATLAYGAMDLSRNFAEQNFIGSLMPDDRQPKSDDEARRRADMIIRDYPDDPRGHFYKALDLADRGDHIGMEAAARKAVELAERYPGVFRARFRDRVRMVHAMALKRTGKTRDAEALASPLCRMSEDTDVKDRLRRDSLC